ncbi:hypothetical protein D021_3353B, partial [Vibrio parahaemolyticus 10296]
HCAFSPSLDNEASRSLSFR